MKNNEKNDFKMTPKDFFMHFFDFVLLYVSIISLITLLFQYVNVLFPDKLNFYLTEVLATIRWSSSALVIVFAVFLLISWLLEKDLLKNPAKRDLKFRKWLIYFTLFASAITIVIDLITLVYNFYSGEISIRFYLKVFVVLAIAAGVFGYYFWDLKRTTDKKYRLPKILGIVAAIVVLASIIGGFFIAGSPATQRQRRFDEQRVNDLQILQNEIVNYWTQKEKLPEELIDLKNSISGFNPSNDPETLVSYEYNIKGPLSFELCAEFKTGNLIDNQNPTIAKPEPYYGDPYRQNWSHETGRTCFSRIIDPELYKKEKKLPL